MSKSDLREILPRRNKIGNRRRRRDYRRRKEKPNKLKDLSRKERKNKVKKSDYLYHKELFQILF